MQVTNPVSYILDTVDPAGGPYVYVNGEVSTSGLAYHREQITTNLQGRLWYMSWLCGQVQRHERKELMKGTYGHRRYLQGALHQAYGTHSPLAHYEFYRHRCTDEDCVHSFQQRAGYRIDD